MPPAVRRLTPIRVDQVAVAALNGLARRKPRIEVPWQPRLLMFAQAVSPRLGDLFVNLLQTRILGRVFGTFRGRTYQHG